MTKTKFEVMEICNAVDIPVGPILSMKEIAEEQSLRKTGTVVEVDHPDARQVSDRRQSDQAVGLDLRGEALAAAGRAHRGNPEEGARLPAKEIAEIKNSGAMTAPKKEEKAA